MRHLCSITQNFEKASNMKFIDEYRDKKLISNILKKIDSLKLKYIPTLMEVCGTHTMAIFRNGIPKLLEGKVNLISGPGCPVCVSPNSYLDRAIALSKNPNHIITTFGDMMRVPGSTSSLEKAKASGADIRIIYSPLNAIKIAEENKDKKVIFLGVGFETTAPTIAMTILEAKKKNIKNFFVLTSLKTIPPAMKILVDSKKLNIDGFICPGHVSVIIGAKAYEFISRDYKIPCVITGFEPFDIVQGIYMLLNQISNAKAKVEIQYNRAVNYEGNTKAQEIMSDVFEPSDADWRGIGTIKNSGLKINDEYKEFDAINIKIAVELTKEAKGCICGDVLKGIKKPSECKLFRKVCNPMNPIGACMVSTEGTCAAYYKYSEK